MITHLVLDGVGESSLGIGVDVVGAASRITEAGLAAAHGKSGLRQRVVSLDGAPVRSGAGRLVAVEGALGVRGFGAADVLVVPGVFAATARTIDRVLAREDIRRAAQLVARIGERGTLLAASCSGTFLLAASGVLEGKRATTTWWLAPNFAQRFPEVVLDVDRMVVEADNVLTAGSAFAHADLMLAVLARVVGPSLASLVARYLVVDGRPSQARYMVMEHLRVSDPALQAVEQFVAANVDRQISVEELARAAALSPRTLARRLHAGLGMTPHELVQRVRMSHAAHLLETTRISVDEVSSRVGYADAASFRRAFRHYAGASPKERRAATASASHATRP